MKTSLYIFLFLIFFSINIFGQNQKELSQSAIEERDTSSIPDSTITINIVAPTDSAFYDKSNALQFLYGNVVVEHDSVFIKCDSAKIRNETTLTANGNIVLNKGDTLFAYGDSLEYEGRSSFASLFSELVIVQSKDVTLTAKKAIQANLDSSLIYYNQGGQIENDTFLILSRRGLYDISSEYAFFRDSVVFVLDSLQLFADSLNFDQKEMKAYFVSPTRIENNNEILYCESGYYDLRKKVGLFVNNAEFSMENGEGKADSILYYSETGHVILSGNAFVEDSTRTFSAGIIDYDRTSGMVNLKGNAEVVDSSGVIRSQSLFYNVDTEQYYSEDSVHVKNDRYELLSAGLESVDTSSDLTLAYGDVIWKDLESGNRLRNTDSLLFDQKNRTYTAFGERNPILEIVSEKGDTTLIMSKTIESFKKIIDSQEYFFVKAVSQVELYNPAFSAVSDTMLFDGKDSTLHLIHFPMIWNDSMQIWGDSISIFMKNGDPDRAFIRDRAFAASKTSVENLINQASGKQMTVFFESGKVNRLYMQDNAQSIYYVEDEQKKYIGANAIKCSEYTLFFNEGNISRIMFLNQIDGTFYDINKLNPQELTLEGIELKFENKPVKETFYD